MQEMKEEDVLKEFTELMMKQNMGDRSKDFSDMLQYVIGIQLQLGVMIGELRDIKEQLAQMNGMQQGKTPEQRSGKASDKAENVIDLDGLNEVSSLEGRLSALSGRLSELKSHLIDTAQKTVNAYMEKGRMAMEKVFQKGMSIAKKTLTSCRTEMSTIVSSYSRTADTVDRIGNELKQAKNSTANAGRILFGKETKEAPASVQGVAFTRMVNAPVKGIIKFMQEDIGRIDKLLAQIEKHEVKEKTNAEKESLIGKLHQKQEAIAIEQKNEPKEKERSAPDKAGER